MSEQQFKVGQWVQVIGDAWYDANEVGMITAMGEDPTDYLVEFEDGEYVRVTEEFLCHAAVAPADDELARLRAENRRLRDALSGLLALVKDGDYQLEMEDTANDLDAWKHKATGEANWRTEYAKVLGVFAEAEEALKPETDGGA